MKKRRLLLNEDICMCSGVACPQKSECYRFRLSEFFDQIAKVPHTHPMFIEPCWDSARQSCHFYLETRFIADHEGE